jgi:hypothetical protein
MKEEQKKQKQYFRMELGGKSNYLRPFLELDLFGPFKRFFIHNLEKLSKLKVNICFILYTK